MTRTQIAKSAGRGLLYGAGALAGAYAAYVGSTWLRYGHADPGVGDDADPLLDLFMPTCDVADRHHVAVAAPAELAFKAACEVDFTDSAAIKEIFRAREYLMGAAKDTSEHPKGLLALTTSIGWGVLAEIPDHEIVVGTVTQPWKANVVFRAVPPDAFAAFSEPDWVKIVWTLRADSVGSSESILRTETRAIATDPQARRKFRRYWSLVSPGIVFIRRFALPLAKAAAERRAAPGIPATRDRFELVSAGDLDPEC